ESVAGVVAAEDDLRDSAAEDGVQGVPPGSDATALPDRAYGGSVVVPAVAVESVGSDVVRSERAVAATTLDLTRDKRHRGPDASIPGDTEPKKGPRAWQTQTRQCDNPLRWTNLRYVAARQYRKATWPGGYACFGSSSRLTERLERE